EIASEKLSDSDSALDLVRKVLARNAGDPLALQAASRIHMRTGHHEDAVAQLRVLLSHTRRGPAAVAVLAEIAALSEEKLRKRDEALGAYREAYRIDPGHPLPPPEIRRLLLAGGDLRAAAEELAQMAATAPTPAARAKLLVLAAEIYDDRLDDLDRAIPHIVQARIVFPQGDDLRQRLQPARSPQGQTP